MPRHDESSVLRRLRAAIARGVVPPEGREPLLGAVLTEVVARMTAAQWRAARGWLPADVRSLIAARGRTPSGVGDDLADVVAAAAGVSRTVGAEAVRAVLAELARILPPGTLPPSPAADASSPS